MDHYVGPFLRLTQTDRANRSDLFLPIEWHLFYLLFIPLSPVHQWIRSLIKSSCPIKETKQTSGRQIVLLVYESACVGWPFNRSVKVAIAHTSRLTLAVHGDVHVTAVDYPIWCGVRKIKCSNILITDFHPFGRICPGKEKNDSDSNVPRSMRDVKIWLELDLMVDRPLGRIRLRPCNSSNIIVLWSVWCTEVQFFTNMPCIVYCQYVIIVSGRLKAAYAQKLKFLLQNSTVLPSPMETHAVLLVFYSTQTKIW